MGGTVRQATTRVSNDMIQGITTSGNTIMNPNNNRASLSLQNVGTKKVFIRFNTAVLLGASPGYSFVLSPASGTDEGDGGVLSVDNFAGKVYGMTASGASTIVATEFNH